MIIKKQSNNSILFTFFTFVLITSQNVLSERWSCSYEISGESKPAVFVRKDDTFLVSSIYNSMPYEIIKEKFNFIHLYRNDELKYYAVMLNKENNRFAMIYLDAAEDTSAKISGNCIVSNE
tara:strand:- start:236 stop:598 length:363 start_codon:yes stop_codon:yes gene_type:complete